MLGSVDARGRPCLRVDLLGARAGFLAVLDTGFNGELMMSGAAAAKCGFSISSVQTRVEVAAGSTAVVNEARGTVVWMGVQRHVEVLVHRQQPPVIADEPVALIGTRLLTPHRLTIDFDAGTVEVAEQES